MKFIHIADVHLGMMPERKKGLGMMRKREIEETFQRVLLEAKQKKVDVLLISGDLYDQPPLLEDLKELNARLEALSPIKVVLIAGNHDCILESSPYERFEFANNVIFLKGKEIESVYVEELETTFWGLSYHQKEITAPLYDDLRPQGQGYHILVAHGGDENHIPIQYEDLKWSGFDYIALGHIHKPQVLVEDFMNYPGSLEPLDYTERGEHGYFLGEITEDGQQVEFIRAAKRMYDQIYIQVDETETLYSLSKRVEQEIETRGRDNFYEIYLLGYTPLSGNIQFEALEQDYFITQVVDKTKKNYDLERLFEENRENILGQFIDKMRNSQDPMAKEAMEFGIEALLATKTE